MTRRPKCPACVIGEGGVLQPCGACLDRYHEAMARLCAERGFHDLARHERALAKQGSTAADADRPRRALGGDRVGAAPVGRVGNGAARPRSNRRSA